MYFHKVKTTPHYWHRRDSETENLLAEAMNFYLEKMKEERKSNFDKCMEGDVLEAKSHLFSDQKYLQHSDIYSIHYALDYWTDYNEETPQAVGREAFWRKRDLAFELCDELCYLLEYAD